MENLRQGEIVSIGVENSYVASADPTHDLGLIEFRDTKEFGEDYYYPVFVSAVEDLMGFVSTISDTEKLLASSFWPGQLNIEFKVNLDIPNNLGAQSPPSTLVARKPKNPLLNAITDLLS